MSLSRSQRVNIFTDNCWTDWFFSRSLHGIQLNFQKTKIFGSTSIIHLSDVQVSDRYLINVGPGSLSSGFALATPGGACLAVVFCWSCRETVCYCTRLAGHLATVAASTSPTHAWSAATARWGQGHKSGFATRKTWTCTCDIRFRCINSLHVATWALTNRRIDTSKWHDNSPLNTFANKSERTPLPNDI